MTPTAVAACYGESTAARSAPFLPRLLGVELGQSSRKESAEPDHRCTDSGFPRVDRAGDRRQHWVVGRLGRVPRVHRMGGRFSGASTCRHFGTGGASGYDRRCGFLFVPTARRRTAQPNRCRWPMGMDRRRRGQLRAELAR